MQVYQSDDYAGLEIPDLVEFYYGYEHTVNDGVDEDDENWDDSDEWCFVATENGEEIARLTMSEIIDSCNKVPCEPNEFLIAGIGILIKRGTLSL